MNAFPKQLGTDMVLAAAATVVGDAELADGFLWCEVGAFYWTVPAPDIVNPGRVEQGSVSV